MKENSYNREDNKKKEEIVKNIILLIEDVNKNGKKLKTFLQNDI